MISIEKDNGIVYKALTTVVIEKTLIEIGKPVYDKVIKMINSEYHCYLTDCYEHPEYLKKTLEKLYGNAHSAIVRSIQEQLEQFSFQEDISLFIKTINQ
jgi:hypothetical protein